MNSVNQSKSSTIKRLLRKPEFSSLLIFAIMFILTAIMQNNFFARASIMRNINAFAPLILLTMGQAVVIISGALDLSAGASLSLMTCILTFVMKTDQPMTGITAIIITFAAALVIGLINGFGAGVLRIPPVILTFATSYMWLGIALFLRPTPGGETVEWFKAFYDFKSIANASPALVKFGTYVSPALFLIIIGCLIWFFVSKTRTGRYFYAVGSNGDGAYETGINPATVQIKAYVMNAVYIFLTSLFFVGQNLSGDARMGDPMTLKAIAAAVVGGIALSGGKGSVYFALVGALIMELVNKIIFFADIPNAFQTLVSGLIVILAIASSTMYSRVSQKDSVKENS